MHMVSIRNHGVGLMGLQKSTLRLVQHETCGETPTGGVHARTHTGSPLTTLRMQPPSSLESAHPVPVLRFWGKMTMPNAGTMAYRRDFPSTTRI